MRTPRRRLVVLVTVVAALSRLCLAGPPFETDDPEPVQYKHWEFYLASGWQIARSDLEGTLPHIEINHGVAPDVQLHFIAPMKYTRIRGVNNYGYSDSEFGIKYRFIRETESMPQVGVFPLLEIPTGQKSTGLGAGTAQMLFPIWIQKSFDKLTTYGGGGYWYNPGLNDKDFVFVGWEAQYDFTEAVTLGGELTFHSAESDDEKPGTGFNLGGIINLTRHEHVLFSAGHSLSGDDNTSVYFALQLTR